MVECRLWTVVVVTENGNITTVFTGQEAVMCLELSVCMFVYVCVHV